MRTLTDEQRSAVEALTRSMMNKLLHPTMQAIKAAAADGDIARLEAIRTTFDPQRVAAYSAMHAMPQKSADLDEAALTDEGSGVSEAEEGS